MIMPRSKLTNVQAMGKRGRRMEADRQVSALDALNTQRNVISPLLGCAWAGVDMG
jgi:hypothetical protein